MKLFAALVALALIACPLQAETRSLVVNWDDAVPNATIWDRFEALGVEARFNSAFSDEPNITVADVDAAKLPGLLAALRATPGVVSAEENVLFQALDRPWSAEPLAPRKLGPAAAPSNGPDDPLYRYQWHMEQIHVTEAWELTRGEGAVVAVIDTGVAYEDRERFHRVEDLAQTRFVPGWDFVDDDAHPNDTGGHGTHVAGTIAQSTNNGIGVAGVAFEAAIMPVRVLGRFGGTAADVAEGIRFAADHGAHVINMSLGSHVPAEIIEEACRYAKAKGVTLCCAAGNSGQEGVGYPAAYDCCIAVSATRFDETISWYSSWGEGVTLAAPGGDTRVDQNEDGKPDGVYQNTIAREDPTSSDYYLYQGTSMATPHVAGVAALIVSLGVKDPDRVEEILKSSARPKGARGWDPKYGAGILDAAAAVRAAAKERKNGAAASPRTVSALLLSVLPVLTLTLLLLNVRPFTTVLRALSLATAVACATAPLIWRLDLDLLPGTGGHELAWLWLQAFAALWLYRAIGRIHGREKRS